MTDQEQEKIEREIKLAKINKVFHKKRMEYFEDEIKILEDYLDKITPKVAM